MKTGAMKKDYTKQIDQYWPTIMQAWNDYADKHPVIECDVVKRQVMAWSAQEYINGLSERTREMTRRQFRRATAAGGIMVFIRDSRNRVLQSHVYMPDDTSKRKPNQTVQRTGASRSASGTDRMPGAAGSRR
jgi:hypothetical protein